jgi:hypothetical protein
MPGRCSTLDYRDDPHLCKRGWGLGCAPFHGTALFENWPVTRAPSAQLPDCPSWRSTPQNTDCTLGRSLSPPTPIPSPLAGADFSVSSSPWGDWLDDTGGGARGWGSSTFRSELEDLCEHRPRQAREAKGSPLKLERTKGPDSQIPSLVMMNNGCIAKLL